MPSDFKYASACVFHLAFTLVSVVLRAANAILGGNDTIKEPQECFLGRVASAAD